VPLPAPPDPLAQAEALVRREPPRPAPRRVLGWPRALARRAVLWVLRPYTVPQHELDERLVAALRAEREALARTRDALDEVEGRLGQRIDRLDGLARDLIAALEVQRRRSANVEEVAGRLGELYALPYLAGEPFEQFETEAAGRVTGFRRPPVSGSGSPYSAFQEIFRGPAERVIEGQRPYLELVRDHAPVLDLGSGRGEFLALLGQAGIEARGVERDPGMLRLARERGVDVVEADALAYLRDLEDSSVGCVFSAQVLEHLGADALVGLVELARARLRPGGLFVAETVNPHRLASLKNFWTDPTHHHPLFPETLLALCAGCGYPEAYVFAPGEPVFEEARFRAPVYAIVATA